MFTPLLLMDRRTWVNNERGGSYDSISRTDLPTLPDPCPFCPSLSVVRPESGVVYRYLGCLVKYLKYSFRWILDEPCGVDL